MICYIGVGSNVGDRASYIRKAILFLQGTPGITVKRTSGLYETEPEGGPKDQKDYYNLVIEIDSLLEPKELLGVLKKIETQVGRNAQRERWAQREIDLDILLCEGREVKEEGLYVPHPLLEKRFFVLKPLSDLAPGWRHPGTGLDVVAMLASVKESSRWRRVDEKIIP